MAFNKKTWLIIPAVLLMLGGSVESANADAFYNSLTPTKVLRMLSRNRKSATHKTFSIHRSRNSKKITKHAKKGHKAALVKRAIRAQNSQISSMSMSHFAKARQSYRYSNITPNTRDLGGYMGANGRFIKPGKLIRSARLEDLTSNGRKSINALHVHQIIDLRNLIGHSSVLSNPDPDELTTGYLNGTRAKYSNMAIYPSKEYPRLMRAEHKNGGGLYFYGKPAVTNPNAIKAYRAIFRAALNNKHGAILFHCDLGRDRTGVTSALLLSALGVNKNTIYHDYLLTNQYHAGFRKVPERKMKARLNRFYHTIDAHYGSMDNYLHHGIGLTNSAIQKLDNIYLTK